MTTPTGTPLPPPEPAVYLIQDLAVELLDGERGALTGQVSWAVLNVGGLGGPETVPVSLWVEGSEPEIVQNLMRPREDQPVGFSVELELEPKIQTVVVRVADVEQVTEFDARVPDIAIESVQHNVVADGSIEILVEVTNEGEVPGRDVIVSVEIATASDGDDGAPMQRRDATLETVVPGDAYDVSLPLDMPTGLYQAIVAVEAGNPETVLENNQVEASLEVEYVHLSVLLESSETVGYENDGDGVVEASIRVANQGVAPSGPIEVGVVCPAVIPEGCTHTVQMESIPPSESSVALLVLAVPQGESAVAIFGGANDDGYQWGDSNVGDALITVPSKPAVALALQAQADVTGYWSNGMAQVDFTGSLRNEGYEQVLDSQAIKVVCKQGEEAIDDCGGDLTVDLEDGFGPAEGSLALSAPMGTILEVSVVGEEEGIQLEVPERILGVDRYVWECYSDRPGHRDGCGGWKQETIDKWEIDRPVRLWRTGSADYLAISLAVLRELTPLLGLEFELVESEEEADVKAYFGVPRSTALELGWPHCEDAAGCASWSVHDHRVTSGIAGVWQQESPHVTFEFVRAVVLHEMLHVMVPIGHRQAFDTRLATDHGLSVIDEEMIRLHSHPLIKAGMSISDVRDVIVLNEDLLDPQPLSPYREVHEAVRQAARVLEEAESVRFQVSGEWRGTCGPNPVGPGVYEVGDIEGISAGSIRYREGEKHYLILDGSEHWEESRGKWKETDGREIFDATYWAPTHPNPFTILTSILALGNDKNISVVSRSGGKIVIKTSSPLTERVANTSMTIDEETHQIESYEEQIRLRRGCRLVFGGGMGEYGIGFEIPSEIVGAARDSEDDATTT